MTRVAVVAAALMLLGFPLDAAAQNFAGAGEDTPAEVEDEDRLRGEALQRDLPGIEMTPALPPVRVTPALNFVIPYQLVGLALTVEALPVQWLRFAALYSFGSVPSGGELTTSHYAEGLLGVRLFGVVREAAVDIPLKPRGSMFSREPPTVKAWVPAYHALFVEAGMLSGLTSLDRCSGGCLDAAGKLLPPDDRQLFIPMAGLRYAYAFEATAVRRNVRRRFLLEAYAQLFAPPLKSPPSARFIPNGDSAGSPGIGGRIGVELPPFGCLAQIAFGSGCLGSDISVGYASYPRYLYFAIRAGYPIY